MNGWEVGIVVALALCIPLAFVLGIHVGAGIPRDEGPEE